MLLPLACLIMGMVFSLLDDEEKIINNYPAKQEERVNETRIYTYDSLNRMITSKKTDNISQTVSNASYTYDKVGNCTKSVEDGVTTYSTYNSLNQLVYRDVSKNGTRVGLTFYSYDANGNQILEQKMVSPPTITETIEKEYDSSNQLTKVICREGNASGLIKYTQENTYNYDGQRISKTDNGGVIFAEQVLNVDWKDKYPPIASSPDILGTLCNNGKTKAHNNPKSNEFGRYVKKYYKKVSSWLDAKTKMI